MKSTKFSFSRLSHYSLALATGALLLSFTACKDDETNSSGDQIIVTDADGRSYNIEDIRTAENVDLERYQGTWFQLYEAITDNSDTFADNEGVMDSPAGIRVNYVLQEDGTVRLTNTSREGDLQGKEVQITGTATPVNEDNSKLTVEFDPIFLQGQQFDYWILYVDPDYTIALLAAPNSAGFSILTRSKTPDPDLLQSVIDRATSRGLLLSETREIPQ